MLLTDPVLGGRSELSAAVYASVTLLPESHTLGASNEVM